MGDKEVRKRGITIPRKKISDIIDTLENKIEKIENKLKSKS